MSKRNAEFFEEKKYWSRIKDTLLGAYLPVCFQKVIHAKKPIVYKERVDDETRRVLFCFLSDPYQPL